MSTSAPRHMPVIAREEGLGPALLETIAGQPAEAVELPHEQGNIALQAFEPASLENAGLTERLNNAVAVIVLVQHVDNLTLDRLRDLFRRLPGDTFLPQGIIILRDAGRVEFKMSCPTCGQKLWVRDADVGRAGRCPHCKKTFMIPAQQAHVRSNLSLAEHVPVTHVSRGNATAARHAVDVVAGRIRHTQQILKSTTMRVQIDPEDLKT